MRSRIARRFLLSLAVFAIAAADSATFAASRRLSEVRKIYVGSFSKIGHDKRGRTVVVAHGSPDEVRKQLTAALVSSGRFSVVAKEAEADARLEGTAGFINTDEHTSGFAEL